MMNQFNFDQHEHPVNVIKDISFGARHALIFIEHQNEDILFSVGSNVQGQLGIGNTKVNVGDKFCHIKTFKPI